MTGRKEVFVFAVAEGVTIGRGCAFFVLLLQLFIYSAGKNFKNIQYIIIIDTGQIIAYVIQPERNRYVNNEIL